MNEQVPSNEQRFDFRVDVAWLKWDLPEGIGERPATSAEMYMWAEIERLDKALASSRDETARACQEYRELLEKHTQLLRASPEPPAVTSREAFQEWATGQGPYDFRRSDIFGRTYHHELTEHAWRGWANALAKAAQPPPVPPDRPTFFEHVLSLLDMESSCAFRAYVEQLERAAQPSTVDADAIFKFCCVTLWPQPALGMSLHEYPIEHNPIADKDCRALIEAKLQPALTKPDEQP